MGELSEALALLRTRALTAQVRGRFLLSTADLSDFWIDINEFLANDVVAAMSVVLGSFLSNCLKHYGPLSIAIPMYTDASEKTFPLRLVVDGAIQNASDPDALNTVLVSQETGTEAFCLDRPPGRPAVVVVGVSVHLTMLLGVIAALQRSCSDIVGVFAFICREKTSLERLRTLGIPFVAPLVARWNDGAVFTAGDLHALHDPSYGYVAESRYLLFGDDHGHRQNTS